MEGSLKLKAEHWKLKINCFGDSKWDSKDFFELCRVNYFILTIWLMTMNCELQIRHFILDCDDKNKNKRLKQWIGNIQLLKLMM